MFGGLNFIDVYVRISEGRCGEGNIVLMNLFEKSILLDFLLILVVL